MFLLVLGGALWYAHVEGATEHLGAAAAVAITAAIWVGVLSRRWLGHRLYRRWRARGLSSSEARVRAHRAQRHAEQSSLHPLALYDGGEPQP